MLIALRSLLTLATLLAACAVTSPAFAQDAPSPVEAGNVLAWPLPPAPGAPKAPGAPAEVPAIAETVARDPREQVIDESFAKYLTGLGPHLTEFLHGRLLAWKEELKALLLELPLS